MFSGVGCLRKTAVVAAEGRRAAAEQVPWEQVLEPTTVRESAAVVAAAFVAFAAVSRSLQPGYKSVHFFIRSRSLIRSLIHSLIRSLIHSLIR